MPLNPGGSDETPDGAADNEGPHCRNCHIGASSCNQCHGTKDGGAPAWYFDTKTNQGGVNAVTGLPSGAGNPYQPQQYVHTTAVANLNGQCVDGGFSWPHRTLGANLLKDELYGVDYDGTKIAVGATRGLAKGDGFNENVVAILDNYGKSEFFGEEWQSAYATNFYEGTVGRLSAPESAASLNKDYVENLDSVCIDCHGDATFWNGDNEADYKYSKTYVGGAVGSGWQLMLKGLP